MCSVFCVVAQDMMICVKGWLRECGYAPHEMRVCGCVCCLFVQGGSLCVVLECSLCVLESETDCSFSLACLSDFMRISVCLSCPGVVLLCGCCMFLCCEFVLCVLFIAGDLFCSPLLLLLKCSVCCSVCCSMLLCVSALMMLGVYSVCVVRCSGWFVCFFLLFFCVCSLCVVCSTAPLSDFYCLLLLCCSLVCLGMFFV